MKKLLPPLLIAIFFFSIPLHGIAEDNHQDDSSPHHCVLVCHTCCHVAITTQVQNTIPLTFTNFEFSISNPIYQNPLLETMLRPPAFSA